MGKASSAKKVARAARAGSAVKGRQQRELGFPLAVFLVLVLGTGLVVYSRANRATATPPTLEMHWHAAYAVYDCTKSGDDKFLAPIADNGLDPNGIHTHGDGVIHIHPFNSSVTGTRARLGVFFDTVGIKVDGTSSLTLPDGTVLTAGAKCGDQDAILQVVRFDADAPDKAGTVIKDKFADIRFLKDREAFTIALAPAGADIPRPNTVATLDNLTDLAETPQPSTGTTVPGAVTNGADTGSSTTVAGATSSTAASGASSTTAAGATSASSTTTATTASTTTAK